MIHCRTGACWERMPGTPGAWCWKSAGCWPHPLAQSCHCTGSVCNALVDLTVKRQVAGDDRAKVCEVVSNLKHLLVNSDGGGRWNVLTHDFFLPDADGEAKLLTGMRELADKLLELFLCVWSVRYHQQKVAPWWGLYRLWSWPSAVPGWTACHHFWCVGGCLPWSVWKHGSTEVRKKCQRVSVQGHTLV